MDKLKSIFSTKTAKGRMIRTFVQAAVGFTALMSAMVVLPEFQKAMQTVGLAGQTVAVASFVAAMSGAMSALEKFYEKLRKWADGED